MKINILWNRRKPGIRRKQYEYLNMQNIEVNASMEEHEKIYDELMKHRPKGEGWMLTGYCVKEE